MRDRKDMDTYIEKKVEEFRKEFKCIENGCDGDGNIPVQVSLDEWIADECQFHAEYLIPMENTFRQALTKTAEKARVEGEDKVLDMVRHWSKGIHSDAVDCLELGIEAYQLDEMTREELKEALKANTKN